MIEAPITSSATLRVLLYGALKTATPLRVAAFRSTWFTPMQKQPMACNFSAASSTFLLICVLLRMPSRCTSFTAAMSSCSLRAPFIFFTLL